MKITVIVAAYNTEHYISDCITSVLKNKENNIELIVIDDGSTDNTGKILDSFCDNRLKVIQSDNKGQSASRNIGISLSSGDYIMFLDSDDKLDDNAFKTIISIIKEKQTDLIFFGSKVFFDDANLVYRFNPSYERDQQLCNKRLSGTEFFRIAMKVSNYIVNCGLYIANRRAMNNLLFYEGIIHEDNIFTTRILLENDISVYCINEKLHWRRIRQGSIMTQRKTEAHLKGYYTCIYELIHHPPRNFHLVREEYYQFVTHMVDCFKYTNDDIILALEKDLSENRLTYQHEITRLNHEILELKNSNSWKITSPLRKLMLLLKR